MTIFYKNYISLCAKANKAPSAVAEDVGLSRTSPNGWKKGKVPRDATLEKIADYFGVTVEALTEKQNNKPATPEGDELTEMQQKAFDMIKQMTDDQLKAFIAAAEAFLR